VKRAPHSDGRINASEHSEQTIERVSGDPRFVRSLGVLAAGDDSNLDALATMASDAFDVEDGDRHRL
jgi:hypothetical protein